MSFSLRFSSDVICSEEMPLMGIDAGIIDGRSIVLRECTPSVPFGWHVEIGIGAPARFAPFQNALAQDSAKNQ